MSYLFQVTGTYVFLFLLYFPFVTRFKNKIIEKDNVSIKICNGGGQWKTTYSELNGGGQWITTYSELNGGDAVTRNSVFPANKRPIEPI